MLTDFWNVFKIIEVFYRYIKRSNVGNWNLHSKQLKQTHNINTPKLLVRESCHFIQHAKSKKESSYTYCSPNYIAFSKITL